MKVRSNNKGFTLVELLVVMAIIAILASIVVPNVINYLKRAKATRARADIAGIEAGLVKMLTDSGRTNLGQLLDSTYVPGEKSIPTAIGVLPGQTLTPAGFRAAVEIYSNIFYALLRDGRGAGTLTDPVPGAIDGAQYRELINPNIVRKLSTSYIAIGFDPWGSLFNIYPGPWPANNGPTPFRKYDSESASNSKGERLPGRGDSVDALTCGDDGEQSPDLFFDQDAQQQLIIGYPAPRDKVAFIWSNGENLFSGQAIYNPPAIPGDLSTQYDPNNSQNYYDLTNNQDGLQLGGGDDVNNWDNGQSWGRFY